MGLISIDSKTNMRNSASALVSEREIVGKIYLVAVTASVSFIR